jgi:4-hydroxybenzoate polyprenyltransferase
MKLIKAFFRLIRWPNLIFIALAQCLFYYCIILPNLPSSYFFAAKGITPSVFTLIVAASILIAAGGYIINDYFDINIDQINKPEKMVVEKLIKRRWAIFFHLAITTVGVICSLFAALQTNMIILIVNIFCTLLLWFYSTTFKKKLLSGNLIISALTAWTIFVLYFATYINFAITKNFDKETSLAMLLIFKLSILYAGFAFIISLVREAIKDMEDMQGDAKYNCKTMPIAWGIPATKVFVGVWLIVLIGALSIIQFYVLQFGWWLSAVYCLLLILLPLLFILKKLYQAKTTSDYHQLSNITKLVMFTGILSIIFFKYYAF